MMYLWLQQMKKARSTKTLTSLVANRSLPEGDVETQLKFLQAVILDKMTWARACAATAIDKTTYLHFVGLLASALYCFSPQGRTSGIEDMKMSQLPALFVDGYAQSSVFKTNSKYGFQPVTLSTVSAELLKLFISSIRPSAATSSVVGAGEPIFIKWQKGISGMDVGRAVVTFFLSEASIHITTTLIRSVVETVAETLLRQGKITMVQRKAIESVNGHSSATVQNFYLQEDRTADVYSGREVFLRASSTSLTSHTIPITVPIDAAGDGSKTGTLARTYLTHSLISTHTHSQHTFFHTLAHHTWTVTCHMHLVLCILSVEQNLAQTSPPLELHQLFISPSTSPNTGRCTHTHSRTHNLKQQLYTFTQTQHYVCQSKPSNLSWLGHLLIQLLPYLWKQVPRPGESKTSFATQIGEQLIQNSWRSSPSECPGQWKKLIT